MQKRLLIATLTLAAALLIIGLLPVHGEGEIYDTVVRLHVLAASDSVEDQTLKLKVRDAVLEKTTPLLSDCKEQSEAIEILAAHASELEAIAAAVVAEEGRSDPISLSLGTEEYPTRDYNAFCFPSGEYVSLKIEIGEGEGQNWWCCLFPPLCLGAATVSKEDAEDACISVGLTPSQYKIITETDKPVYRARFKLLELLGDLF